MGIDLVAPLRRYSAMSQISSAALEFLGGGLGSALRYAVGAALPKSDFPWATMSVNLIGSFAIGVLAKRFEGSASDDPWRLLLIVGLLGGFTTFSAFSHDNLALIRSGSTGAALINAGIQVVGGLALAAVGYALTPAAAG